MPSTVPDSSDMHDTLIHVAVGVVQNAKGEILITKRPEHLHQGGLWEFPGGKLEQGEDALAALCRELKEEVGITVEQADAMIQIPFHYPEQSVLLDVFRIKHFTGEPSGLEGQSLQWLAQKQLDEFDFPEANRAIINSLRLPEAYLISGEFADKQDFLSRLEGSLKLGIKLVQLRVKDLAANDLAQLAKDARELCEKYQAQLLVNSHVELARQLSVGLHLNSRQLMACDKRPLTNGQWLAASVHNEAELQKANLLGVDFIVISPVLPTRSHPGASVLDWDGFECLVKQASMPVYALGGMSANTLARTKQSGAHGIAAISAFWKTP